MISIEDQPRNGQLLGGLAEYGLTANVVAGVDLVSDEAAVAVDSLVSRRAAHLSRGEVGCALSHRMMWRKMLVSGMDWGLIVEDDVEIVHDPRPAIASAGLVAAVGPVIVSLAFLPGSSTDMPLKRKPILGSETSPLHSCLTQTWGTGAYLVNAAAAAVLLAGDGRVHSPADWPFEATRCKFLVALPPPFTVAGHGNLYRSRPGWAPSAFPVPFSRALRKAFGQWWAVPGARGHPSAILRWNQAGWPIYGGRMMMEWLTRLDYVGGLDTPVRFWRL